MSISFKRVMAISIKNLQTLLNDKRTIGLLIFMPVLMMLLFGYGFGQQVEQVPIKILNLDEGGNGIPMFNISDTEYSDLGINFLDEDDRVDISQLPVFTIIDEEIEKVYGGDNYYALIIFPENFSENMLNISEEINITTYLDGSDVMTIGSVTQAISGMISEILTQLSGEKSHLNVNIEYVAGGSDLRPIDTMAPGIFSFSLLLFMILTVTGGFTKERISGTMDRVLATPTSKSDFILGYLLGNSLIALIQSVLLLLIAVFVFNLSVIGNLFLLYAILFIYAISCVGTGILASSFAETQLQAFQFIPLILIPSMFFSGFLFPLNSFPLVFQYLSYIIPMTYSIRISRAIMINGFGVFMFWEDLLILLGLTIAYLGLALLIFRTKKD